ncbi:hypothetical protein CANINC_004331 [Pichia inconspicua]|uniref:Major facilitator superfamily (MFS) profile domain-containing protein n=1 Tax=Pichia inconspicua TaxID=52247 RepID=A0A4T0WXY6_9ASCO|nr:hypothetical protein CANINC_004331 [[Candida] inconspicua]
MSDAKRDTQSVESDVKQVAIESFTDSVISIEDESPNSYNNPFLNEKMRVKYSAIYENAKYECRHRFDPDFKWTKQEEKRLTWKLDFKVTLLACFLFTALQMDRSNMAQAVSDNLLKDLGLTTNNYNTGNTIFYVCFLAAELPSQLISKRLGADIWIPIQMTCWSLVTICQFKLQGKNSLYACRALLGLFEGGFIPDLVLWLSYFYTSAELTIRLSYFWTTMYITTIINYLLAYGILHLRGVHGHPGWAWLFLIEGLITLAIGISAFFLMRPSAVQTKTPWNKKGWFTEEEEKIIVNKVLRDDPSKGDMHNRQAVSPKMLWEALCDWHLWPMYLIGLVVFIPEKTTSQYMTLLLKGMGFNTFHTNLLCIPFNVLKLLMLLTVSYFSEYISNIFGVAMIQPIWTSICVGVLRFWPGSLVNKWGTYALLTVLLGDPYIHAILVSATSRNSSSIKTRTVAASVYNMFVQAGSIVGSNIYRTPDKPLYHKGNSVLFAFALFGIVLLGGTKLFYIYLNKKKDELWNAMTDEEKDDYIENSPDTGSSRLDFRFAN